jgi:hypothetical protein
VALVTGGGRGVGRDRARRSGSLRWDPRLLRAGARVDASATRATGNAGERVGRRRRRLVAVERAVRTTEDELGPVSVLVNDAGTSAAIGPVAAGASGERNRSTLRWPHNSSSSSPAAAATGSAAASCTRSTMSRSCWRGSTRSARRSVRRPASPPPRLGIGSMRVGRRHLADWLGECCPSTRRAGRVRERIAACSRTP